MTAYGCGLAPGLFAGLGVEPTTNVELPVVMIVELIKPGETCAIGAALGYGVGGGFGAFGA